MNNSGLSIDSSVFKYYKAIQLLVSEILNDIDCLEVSKKEILNESTETNSKLIIKYKYNESYNDEENFVFENRHAFFKDKFYLGLSNVKEKLLNIKKQADDIEASIEKAYSSGNPLCELANIEKKDRASFVFVAETSYNLFYELLDKIESFEKEKEINEWILKISEEWEFEYKNTKTVSLTDLINSCSSDSIESHVYNEWCSNWNKILFEIEKCLLPIIQYELDSHITSSYELVSEDNEKANSDVENDENEEIIDENTEIIEIPEIILKRIITTLENYKLEINNFFANERKGIYQNYIFQPNGELQDKLETESRLYKCTAKFQSDLQKIIFDCAKSQDRIFILDWASNILDIQIEDIIEAISNTEMNQTITEVLNDFAKLKQKNYDIYLADAKSFGEEQERRDREFNSLLFKMRKGIAEK